MWKSVWPNDQGTSMRYHRSATTAGLLACVALTIGSATCAPLLPPVGDGAVKVRGEIVSDGGEPCLVELRRASNDAVAERFTAKGRFERTITIAPGTRSYYFVVSCPGALPFTSGRYEIGGTTHLTKPLDLGRLYFPRRASWTRNADGWLANPILDERHPRESAVPAPKKKPRRPSGLRGS